MCGWCDSPNDNEIEIHLTSTQLRESDVDELNSLICRRRPIPNEPYSRTEISQRRSCAVSVALLELRVLFELVPCSLYVADLCDAASPIHTIRRLAFFTHGRLNPNCSAASFCVMCFFFTLQQHRQPVSILRCHQKVPLPSFQGSLLTQGSFYLAH